MITGEVTANREARIVLVVRGPSGREAQINPVIDTGFTEYLTLSPRLIADLGLPQEDTAETILADGSVVPVTIYRATVVWDGQERAVPVEASQGGSLVGMSMLFGYDLTLRAAEGGPVTIQSIPAAAP